MPFFKRSHQSQPQQPQLQSFILEPILTPSGVVDGTDEGVLTVDWVPDPEWAEPDDLELPEAETLPEGDETSWNGSDGLDAEEVSSSEWVLPNPQEPLPIEIAFITEPSFDGWQYEGGVFTVGDDGLVGIDFLFDGGKYKSELAIFSLDGMEAFDTPETWNRDSDLHLFDRICLAVIG